jgi:hypothetical protein
MIPADFDNADRPTADSVSPHVALRQLHERDRDHPRADWRQQLAAGADLTERRCPQCDRIIELVGAPLRP